MNSITEQNAIALGRGKWSDPAIPKNGWTCVRIEDRGVVLDFCGMCESQRIRYAHHMMHPHHDVELAVGCICAGHMEQDIQRARLRDQWMTRRAGKRVRWLSRKWKMSGQENEWIESDGYRVTVFRRGVTWVGVVSAIDGTYTRWSKLHYDTAEQVKLAAFDIITYRLARIEQAADE
jgi:hypothetical protein